LFLAGGALLALLAAWLGVCGATGSDAAAPLSASQRAQLLSLGPWPPARSPIGQPAQRAAIDLGERLFHSVRLAQAPGGVRCASCHEPWRGFTDGQRVALGLAAGTRNTPTLVDVAQHRRFGWDGGQDELWRQSLRPLADPREMPTDAAHVAALLRDDAQLAGLRTAAFGAEPEAEDQRLMADAGRALAAYVQTLTSARTPFDDWRDALAGGAVPAPAVFPAAAVRGAQLFVGRGGCVACHAGPTLGGDGFAVSMIHSTGPDGRPDPGRAGAPRNVFRVPALRGVAATAPYMHDGSVATLCNALWPHALRPGHAAPSLTGAQRRDLLAFLQALSPVRATDGVQAGGERPDDCDVH
jgi:cytochrome c peroxidase